MLCPREKVLPHGSSQHNELRRSEAPPHRKKIPDHGSDFKVVFCR